MPKKQPTTDNQLRLYQQGQGEVQALPLPPTPPPPIPRSSADPPPPDQLQSAVEMLAGLLRQQSAGSGQSAETVLGRWCAAYLASLRHLQPLRAAPLAGLTVLVEAAAPGLAVYAAQAGSNPDLLGQTLLASTENPAAWRPWVLPWPDALARARQFIPNGGEVAAARLLAAASAARQDGQALTLQPAQPFESWSAAVRPYLLPLVIGPPLTHGSTLALASAAQFPAWLRETDRLRLAWSPETPPVIRAIQQLNAQLYRLTPHLPPGLALC